ncbi:KamA family radical SAM protein [Candidatus Nitrosotenuis aquarius]|uniref:KamA family radical SAM protein n=1 Tax=Candidatus Nitrosotenuis aquarius TaxID=1846278 RepID=UPI001FEA09F2|nr:lysine 2,3-aminomutase [Candidatus Nitrosotenuis aquarius]
MSARLQESAWSEYESPRYVPYTLFNFREIPQIHNLPEEKQFEIEVVGNVLPFKTNNYVVDNLIDWNEPLVDPMFILTFPQKGMLKKSHYDEVAAAIKNGSDKKTIQSIANKIRYQLNPHPAGQMEHNIPQLKDGTKLYGTQHKYKETILFFPSQGQTCHAYCTFCFRWPQFVGIEELKFASKEIDLLVSYLREHQEVSDVLFTGGDPLIMKSQILSKYIDSLLEADLPNLKTIRIGTKSLSYWPYRFLTDDDAGQVLALFERVVKKGIHLAFMAHFNHPVELSTKAAKNAIYRVRKTGAQIRTQSPVLAHINDDPQVWADMWQRQVNLGCVPYYMFVPRDTGAQEYFGVPLVRAQEIFRDAYQNVSGLARTVRGPSMSANPGKIQVLGTVEIGKKKAMVMRFLQGRNPKWVQSPFLAKYDESAIWIDELEPFSGKKFFFEDELHQTLGINGKSSKKRRKSHIITSINNVKSSFEDRIGPRHWNFKGKFP